MWKSIAYLLTASMVVTGLQASPSNGVQRPAFVVECLARQETMYYFGLGSNMLRSKIENRGMNNSKIEVLEMEPGYVSDHRLAFNMRGFAPLEPGMGSLEPVSSPSEPQLAYQQPECHGALVTLTADNYEKVMASEGVSFNQTNRGGGYEEVVVTVVPYDSRKPPVQAVALRARPESRLLRDPCPSERYMTILRDGAKELGLKPEYQTFLQQHPVQQVPKWLKRVAIQNLVATFTTSMVLKWRGFSRLQSRILFLAYVPSTAPPMRRNLSHLATLGLLLPGAVMGSLIQLYFKVSQKSPPPFMARFIKLLDPDSTVTTEASSTTKLTRTNSTDSTPPSAVATSS